MQRNFRFEYRTYLLIVLIVLLALNSADTLALGLLTQYIKRDLGLSDTELGFLTGFAFSLFYAVMGIPLAQWADRGNRVHLIGVTTLLWSVAVATCGFVLTFGQLLAVRIGVAVGEAGCIPTANSLIAQHFSRAERAAASSVYLLGGPLSVCIGYLAAGWLSQAFGWRLTFLLLGALGGVVAMLAVLTLREPGRGRDAEAELVGSRISMRSLLNILFANRSLRNVLICFVITYLFSNGVNQWLPSFFIRRFAMSSGELGSWLTLIYGVVGATGLVIGGQLCARFAANREGLQLKATAIAYAVYGICTSLCYVVSNPYVAFALIGIGALCTSMSRGPLLAIIQSLTPEAVRARAVAVIFFFANLLGGGIGPLALGWLSDSLAHWAGNNGLRYALLSFSPLMIVAAYTLWIASKTVETDVYKIEISADASGRLMPSAAG